MAVMRNTPQQSLTFELERRKSWSFTLAVVYDDEVPIDLTGYTLRFVMKTTEFDDDPRDATNLLVNSVADLTSPAMGLVQFSFQASELDGDPGEYYYTIVATDPGEYSSVLLKGIVNLHANTDSRAMLGTYLPGQGAAEGVVVSLRPETPVKVVTGASSRLIAEAYIIANGNPLEPGTLDGNTYSQVTLARVGQMFISMDLHRSWRRRIDGTWDEVEKTLSWANVIGKPSQFPSAPHTHPWTEVTGKPTTFPPRPHTHPVSGITAAGVPSASTFLRGDGQWAVVANTLLHASPSPDFPDALRLTYPANLSPRAHVVRIAISQGA